MKIGIDGSPLAIPFDCGIKKYASELIFALSTKDSTNEYFIFAPAKVLIPRQKNFHLIVYPKFPPFLKRQIWLPFIIKIKKIDRIHFLEPFGVSLFGSNNVVTIHNTNMNKIYPTESLKYLSKRLGSEFFLWLSVKRANSLIAISRFTAKELKKYLLKNGIKNKNIKVVYEAASHDFKHIGKTKNNYFLCMADFSPRKNTTRIFEAFTLLPEDIRSKYKLYVVVSTKRVAADLKKMALSYGILQSVSFQTGVSNKKLAKLYNLATAFLYPSLYEGFGLPILEAMACGCPVITSNLGVMKETAGGSALLVNPYSAKDISKAMLKIIKSKTIRNKLILRGFERTKKFSWSDTAGKTIRVYESEAVRKKL